MRLALHIWSESLRDPALAEFVVRTAINLQHYVARSGRETRNGRGADQKTEPGSMPLS